MSGNKINSYERQTINKALSESGLKLLRSAHSMGFSPDGALLVVAQAATNVKTYERLTEIAAEAIREPKVRNRLRMAGFDLRVLSEREYSYV